MALRFEVVVNDNVHVVAGHAEAEVLIAGLVFFNDMATIDLHVGGMVGRADQVEWMGRQLSRGDVVTICIIESDHPSPPIKRTRRDPPDVERRP